MPIIRNTIHTKKRKGLAGLFSFVVDDTEMIAFCLGL